MKIEMAFDPPLDNVFTCRLCGEIIRIAPIVGVPLRDVILQTFVEHHNRMCQNNEIETIRRIHQEYGKAMLVAKMNVDIYMTTAFMMGMYNGIKDIGDTVFNVKEFELLVKSLIDLTTKAVNEELSPARFVQAVDSIIRESKKVIEDKQDKQDNKKTKILLA